MKNDKSKIGDAVNTSASGIVRHYLCPKCGCELKPGHGVDSRFYLLCRNEGCDQGTSWGNSLEEAAKRIGAKVRDYQRVDAVRISHTGIQVRKEGDQIVLLNIPSALSQEEALEVIRLLGEAVDRDYHIHCGSGVPILQYHEFKEKTYRLQKLLDRPIAPGNADRLFDAEIKKLCGELGC